MSDDEAMNELFGRRERPDHVDFWRLSEVLLGMDAGFDETADAASLRRLMQDRISGVVDRDSLEYMAWQRVMRLFGSPATVTEVGQSTVLVGLWVDAFVAGAKFQAAGGHQEQHA